MNTINEDPFEYNMSSMENEFDSFNSVEFNQEIGETIDDINTIHTTYDSDNVSAQETTKSEPIRDPYLDIPETVTPDFTKPANIEPEKTILSESIIERAFDSPNMEKRDFTKPKYIKPDEPTESNFTQQNHTEPEEDNFRNNEPDDALSIELQPRDKRELIDLARYAISERLSHQRIELKKSESPNLQQICGAFVTLKRLGHLRGCIGRIFGKLPIYETIQKMAIQAGFYDTRFSPLTKEEWPLIDIEISILTPLKHISSIDEIEVGKHGLFIQKELSSGVFLPQVATEQEWDIDALLENICFKAKLPSFAWKSADLFTFESIVIHSD